MGSVFPCTKYGAWRVKAQGSPRLESQLNLVQPIRDEKIFVYLLGGFLRAEQTDGDVRWDPLAGVRERFEYSCGLFVGR